MPDSRFPTLFRTAMVAVIVTGLAACGGDSGDTPDADGTAAAPEAKTPENKQAVTATQAEGRLPSEAECASQPQASQERAIDLRGVEPGQSYDEVKLILGCTDSTTRIEDAGTYLRANLYGQTVRQVLLATDGRPCRDEEIPPLGKQLQSDRAGGTCRTIGMGDKRPFTEITDSTHVVFTGLQGEETAHAVFRDKTYQGDGRPPIESVRTALIEKYGEPARAYPERGNERLVWVYDTRGRRMSPSNPAFKRCDIEPSFERSQAWSSDCGVTIGARLVPAPDNPLLLATLHLGIMDEAGLYDGQQEMEAALRALQETQQAAEAARAAGAAVDIDL
ncbi:MAG: hypothetical protein V2I25_13090 [Woeseiaceae bacterium]|nr:hypothetical protein [Woeseiaceae bacterium]